MSLSRRDYEAYVAAFNVRDYDRLLQFFADDIVLEAHGFALSGITGFREFYGFFHDHVKETVTLKEFCQGPNSSVAEVVINFVGKKTLTPEAMVAAGLPAGLAVPEGASFDIRYLISYDGAGGKVERIRCAIF